jgi:hypothetical protein
MAQYHVVSLHIHSANRIVNHMARIKTRGAVAKVYGVRVKSQSHESESRVRVNHRPRINLHHASGPPVSGHGQSQLSKPRLWNLYMAAPCRGFHCFCVRGFIIPLGGARATHTIKSRAGRFPRVYSVTTVCENWLWSRHSWVAAIKAGQPPEMKTINPSHDFVHTWKPSENLVRLDRLFISYTVTYCDNNYPD